MPDRAICLYDLLYLCDLKEIGNIVTLFLRDEMSFRALFTYLFMFVI